MSVREEISERYRSVRERIEAACRRSGREPGEVHLLGAAKLQPVEKLRAAFDAGLRMVGENRVQEAERKIPELPPQIEWHLIGPLQSNKAKRAVRLFSSVHSVDREKIGLLLDREAAALDFRLTGFLEINLAAEPSKHGFSPEGLAERVRPLAELGSLEIVGLMAIPPLESEPEAMRPWFRRLRELRDGLFERADWSGRPGWLSMGMSLDFEVAIEEGATHVRIGSALFGPRPE